jgi:hypothetical protein
MPQPSGGERRHRQLIPLAFTADHSGQVTARLIGRSNPRGSTEIRRAAKPQRDRPGPPPPQPVTTRPSATRTATAETDTQPRHVHAQAENTAQLPPRTQDHRAYAHTKGTATTRKPRRLDPPHPGADTPWKTRGNAPPRGLRAAPEGRRVPTKSCEVRHTPNGPTPFTSPSRREFFSNPVRGLFSAGDGLLTNPPASKTHTRPAPARRPHRARGGGPGTACTAQPPPALDAAHRPGRHTKPANSRRPAIRSRSQERPIPDPIIKKTSKFHRHNHETQGRHRKPS